MTATSKAPLHAVAAAARRVGVRAISKLVTTGHPRAAAVLVSFLFPEAGRRRAHLARRSMAHSSRIVHIFDPGLGPPLGHALNFDRAIVTEVERWPGVGCMIWGRLDLDRDVRALLPLLPFFVKGAWWRRRASSPRTGPEIRAEGANMGAREKRKARRATGWNEFHRLRLCDLAPGVIAPGDLAIFHSFLRWSAAGIAGWLRDPSSSEATVVLYFMFTDYLDGSGDLRPEYAELLDALAARSGKRIFILAETREIRDDLIRLADRRLVIEIAPHVAASAIFEELRTKRRRSAASPFIRIGYAGHNRRDRGAHLIPGVVERVTARTSRSVCFSVHFEDPTAQVQEARLLSSMSLVDFRSGILRAEEFYDLLASMDIMLLPYEPGERTQRRGSGIFSEALALGLVMVLPGGSHLALEAARYGAGFTSYEKWDPGSIADSALAAVEDFERLEGMARAAAERWAEERRLSTFIDRVLAMGDTDAVHLRTRSG